MKYNIKNKSIDPLKKIANSISISKNLCLFYEFGREFTAITTKTTRTNEISLIFYNRPEITLQAHRSEISKLFFNFQKKKLYSADVQNKIVEWDFSQFSKITHKIISEGRNSYQGKIVCMAIYDQILVTGNEKGDFQFYDMQKNLRGRIQKLGIVPVDLYYLFFQKSFIIIGESNTEILEVGQNDFYEEEIELSVVF